MAILNLTLARRSKQYCAPAFRIPQNIQAGVQLMNDKPVNLTDPGFTCCRTQFTDDRNLKILMKICGLRSTELEILVILTVKLNLV